MGGVKHLPLIERLWQKIDRRGPDECWPWLAYRNHDGYGKIAIKNGRNGFAHRLAYELTTGDILGARCALHRCDNPACCNPSHIFPGTRADNIADMIAKGRDRKSPLRGSRNPGAKLLPDHVVAIRSLVARGASQSQAGAAFGISQGHVWRIVHRVRWAHVEEADAT